MFRKKWDSVDVIRRGVCVSISSIYTVLNISGTCTRGLVQRCGGRLGTGNCVMMTKGVSAGFLTRGVCKVGIRSWR